MRGLAILGVLITHAGYTFGEGPLVVFMMLSGYGIEESCRSGGLSLYWNKRIRKVWAPYVPVAVIAILVMKINYPGGIVCTLLGLDFNRIADKTMWYISYIMGWYAAFYLIILLTRGVRSETGKAALKLFGLLAFGYLCRYLYNTGLVWHENSGADNYIYSFPLGVLLNDFTQVKVGKKLRTGIWTGVLFISFAYLMRFYPLPYNVLMSMMMAIFEFSLVECVTFHGWAADIIRWFGKYAYPIYLFEGLMLGKKNLWFRTLGSQLLIDLCFVIVTAGIAALYWDGIWSRIDKRIPWGRLIKF